MIVYLWLNQKWKPILGISWDQAQSIRTTFEKAGYGVMILREDEAIQKELSIVIESVETKPIEPTFNGKTLSELQTIFAAIENAPTECDGHTRLIIDALITQANFEPPSITVGQGEILYKGQPTDLPPHFWARLTEDVTGAEWIVDYRLRLWVEHLMPAIDLATVPHGIFPDPTGTIGGLWSDWSYEMLQTIQLEPLHWFVKKALLGEFDPPTEVIEELLNELNAKL